MEPPHLFAQDTDLSRFLRSDPFSYAELSSLAVTWTQTTEMTPLGREKIAAGALKRILSEGCFVQQFAFHDGRFYLRRESRQGSSWPPRTDEIAFDQKVFYAAHNLFYAGYLGSHDPKERPYLHKWLPQNDNPEASYFRDDYLQVAGVRLSPRTKELASSCRPQAELVALLAEGAEVEGCRSGVWDGRSFFRVLLATHKIQEKESLPRRYDIHLDPERGYMICCKEMRDDAGHLLTRSLCTEFEQMSSRTLWLPRRCQIEVYSLAEAQAQEHSTSGIFPSPLYVKTIRVNALDVQPWPEERFQLKYTTPGAYVNDASFPESSGKDGIFYQIPANPQRLDEVIAVRRAFYQAWRSAGKKSRPLRVLFLVLNGVGLAGLGIYFFVRRRKKASCP